MTLTLTSGFSEHTLILTLAGLWMALSVVLPTISSYLMLSYLMDFDDFYLIVTLTFPAQGHMAL